MLRVTVEFVPYGQESQKSEIGRMEISNTGHEDTPVLGNYSAKIVTICPNGDVRASQRSVVDFQRLRWNAWALLYAVLLELGEEGMEGFDDSVSVTV